MSVNITITTAGRAAIINAQNTGTAPVTITQVGLSATAVTPAVGLTALAGEFKRLSGVGGSVVAADTIHINALDDSADAYTVRSFALYLASGTLFAIYGQADPLIVKTAGSAAGLAIDTIFANINAASLTFGNTNFLNPPATTTTAGVARLTTPAEAAAGISALLALTPAAAKAAVLGWLLTQDGAGSGLDADLLDGQDGAYYANIAARLGFTPVNRAGDTMTGALNLPGDPTLAKHATTREWVIAQISSGALRYTAVNKAGDTMGGLLSLFADPSSAMHAVTKQYLDNLVTASAIRSKLITVDGSGSGIDADMLDGKDWLGGQDVSFGVADVRTPNVGSTGGLRLRGNAASGHAYLQVLDHNVSAQWGFMRFNSAGDLDWYGAGGMKVGGQSVWNAGNDGSGSGLDADLLDGLDASAFMRASDGTKAGSNANGNWEERANGFIEQWGVVTGTFVQGTYSHNWPRAFANPYSINLQLTPFNPAGGTNQAHDWWPQTKVVYSDRFEMVVQDSSGTASGSGYHWRALGQ